MISTRSALSVAACFAISLCAAAIEPITDTGTPERPLLIFQAPGADADDSIAHADAILAAWKSVPDALRASAMFQLESPVTQEGLWDDRFQDVVQELQFADVPVVVSIANADPKARYPLNDLAQLLQQFTTIKAVHVQGLAFNEYYDFGENDPLGAPPNVRWLRGAIETAAQYGRLIVIELDELHWLRVMANAWCRPLYETIRKYPDHIVPMNAQRGPQNITRSSALMGLWIEDAVNQWGLACTSDWYRDAGFDGPGQFTPPGNDAEMPPNLYRAMVLNGAMTGATVYRFPELDDLWFGSRRHHWDQAIAPVLTEILDRGYVARKDLVLGKTKIAYRLNPAATAEEFRANLVDVDAVYDEGRMLHGAYGIERAGQIPELVLNTGRHFWIPILSPYALDDTLRRFEEVLLPGALLDAASWRERLEPYYPVEANSTAFVTRVGRAIFVLHTRENLYEEQAFTLTGLPAPVRDLTATREADGIALTWPFREGDLFYKVYRRILPDTDYTLVASDIDARSYRDTDLIGDETVAYTVTALTNERESYESTVNFGDYLVFNTAESRIDEAVLLDQFTTTATSKPIPKPGDTRFKTHMWWPTGLEFLGTNESFDARALVARIEEWELAFTGEDLETVLNIYSENYEDAAGRGPDYVRAAYDAFFKRYRARHMYRQIRRWDFSDYDDSGEVTVALYLRFTGLADAGRFADRRVHFPRTDDGVVRVSFTKKRNAWTIVHTDPPLPDLDDVLQY